MKHKGFWIVILLVTFSFASSLLTLAAPVATTWYVNAATGDDGNDCLTPTTACATIGATVTKALDGDTIEIAAGTYNEHDIEVYEELTLIGAGIDNTIIDAGMVGRAFQVGSAVVIEGLRIQNGLTTSGDIFTESGAAVLNSGSGNLTLRDTLLIENYAIGGGGAIFNIGKLTLENTQILSNTAEGLGGGVYNYNIGVITITQSTLADNTAMGIYGGGIYASGQGVSVFDSTIANNSAGSFGGGISVIMSGATVLDGVTLFGNQAASGAGLFSQQGTITATNTTVSGNVASNNYGGIQISGPDTGLFLQNSTIAYNTRTNTSGTGFNGLMIGNNATAMLVNTILAHNQDRNCASSSPPTSLGHNLSSDFHCNLIQSGDQQGVDPLLGSLADNGGFVLTHALLPGSPAIDAGDDAQCSTTDARGIARPYDGDGDTVPICDIGAFEARHQISIADSTVLEGDSGSVTSVFTVTLAPTSTMTVEVDYQTIDETAIGGEDYDPLFDTLVFDPGETEQYIAVSVTGDTDDELDETFQVQLSVPVNADLLVAEATGTIIDDDGLPSLTITDQSMLEGNTGTATLQFEVTLSPASSSVVTVDYTTVDDTATAGNDYTVADDTLTFQPGQTSQTISVDVLGDNVDEGVSEDFIVQLSDPTNAFLADEQATGTITDDDSARLSQNIGPQVFEGNSGFTPAKFTVLLSTPADFTVTVDFDVSSGYGDDGAQAGEDFVPISGTLTFQPGETEQIYIVQIIGDTTEENDETYSSLISNANVPISVNGSLATILDDDKEGSGGSSSIYLPMLQK